MFKQAQIKSSDESIKATETSGNWKRQTETSSSPPRALILDLPPVISNSSLVSEQASAKQLLVAASVNTAATLPLMIGGRSKFVLNIVHDNSRSADSSGFNETHRSADKLGPTHTASRAEQRKRNNMISVVRPVVSSPMESLMHSSEAIPVGDRLSSRLIEDMMVADKTCRMQNLVGGGGGVLANSGQPEEDSQFAFKPPPLVNEYELKQQLALLRREELELARGIKRQHEFVVGKLEDRKRSLQIIQAVWSQRDFKRAIEKLVDIYHQGLVFSCATQHGLASRQEQTTAGLRSLNTSLVVDVLGVISLRPKLWNLEICQLLLPIIINDLLLAHGRNGSALGKQLRGCESQARLSEVYLDVAIKSLRLIVSQFGSLIRNTIESQKESSRLAGGVDLSREERVNRCLSVYALLGESQRALASLAKRATGYENLAASTRSQVRELEKLLSALFAAEGQRDPVMSRRN